jgi:hypothetical protein
MTSYSRALSLSWTVFYELYIIYLRDREPGARVEVDDLILPRSLPLLCLLTQLFSAKYDRVRKREFPDQNRSHSLSGVPVESGMWIHQSNEKYEKRKYSKKFWELLIG